MTDTIHTILHGTEPTFHVWISNGKYNNEYGAPKHQYMIKGHL